MSNLVLLANGKPAYTRGGFVTQHMINEHGSYQAAREWMAQEKSGMIWCDHCNAEISISGIRSCLRKTCQMKDAVPPGPMPRANRAK